MHELKVKKSPALSC